MKIGPAKARQKQKEACTNQPESLCPGATSRSENVIELDGVGEAWLSHMEEEDTLFNMQDWESVDSASGRDRKKTL